MSNEEKPLAAGAMATTCANCDDRGWGCDNHPDRAWDDPRACTCGGAGAPEGIGGAGGRSCRNTKDPPRDRFALVRIRPFDAVHKRPDRGLREHNRLIRQAQDPGQHFSAMRIDCRDIALDGCWSARHLPGSNDAIELPAPSISIVPEL